MVGFEVRIICARLILFTDGTHIFKNTEIFFAQPAIGDMEVL
jgi:hypothetical protein